MPPAMNAHTTEREHRERLDAEFAARKAAAAAELEREYAVRAADIDARFAMARLDLALVKRAAAGAYVRKRHALRKLVRFGVFTPEEARAQRPILTKLRGKWCAARLLLREV